MTKKSTKKALLLSVLSLVLCCAMLMGTTFAWFTDSVTSMNNIIKSGSLDVVLEYRTSWAAGTDWVEVDDTTKIFNDAALYEPGYTEVVFLRVSNAGTLDLKAQLSANIVSETSSTNVYGEEFFLSDYLQIGTYTMAQYSDTNDYSALWPFMFISRDAALATAQNWTKLADFSGIAMSDTPIVTGEYGAQIMALVLTMPETVGNEANHKSDVAAPEVTFGINLVATQLVSEEDTFGPDYDKDATYPAYNEASLKAAIIQGGTVELVNDIVVDETIELTKDVTINLNGKTIATAANKARPFKITSSDVDLVINGNGGKVTFGDGTYGVIEIAAGSDNATVTVNGGTFEGTTDAGAFVKFRGGDNVQITLNDVTYTDNCAPTSGGTNAWVFNHAGATGSYELTVNGGTYTAANGFACTNATFNGVVMNVAGAGCELVNATLTDCNITLDPGMYVSSADGACVAVSNNGNVVVKNSTLTSTTYALAVYSTGGTITAEGCNITGNTFGVAEGFGTVTVQ